MAKRQNIHTVKTDVVQGPGSTVKIRSVSYEMAMAAREKMSSAHTVAEERDFVKGLLAENIISWDWVDDNDQLLPTPAEGLDINKLTAEEVEFLISALTGGAPAEVKN